MVRVAETPGHAGDGGMVLQETLLQVASSSRTSPLSLPQRRLWALHEMQPDNPRYNMASVVRLNGPLDFPALTNALKGVVARHETLRTRFISNDSEPVQIIEADAQVEIGRTELAAASDAEREHALARVVREAISHPFDLTKAPLIRCRLFKLRPDEHVMVTTMHHLISDEWSFRIFHHELFEIYASALSQSPPALAELPIQYSDYAEWQHELFQEARFQGELECWKQQLSGNPVGVELPTDYPRRSARSCKGAASWRELEVPSGSALETLARSRDASLFMVLLAAFKALLFRYTRQEDIIVGTPVAGRSQVETENLIGFFVNTLALRTRLAGAMTFQELLAQVRETALAAYSNQEVPFERVVEALQPERVAADRTPFINVMFFLQHESGESLQVPGLEITFMDPITGPPKFDLTLIVRQTGNGLVAAASYDADLFAPETISRLLEHYENLLENVVAHPERSLAELHFLGVAERELVVSEWSQTQTDYPRNVTVHELFAEQVRLCPEAIAAAFGGRSLTYRGLNTQANLLAQQLRTRGVKPGALVGLCSERSLEMIVGLLGILKCGAAYAPLDFHLPQQRLSEIIKDLNPPILVVTHQRLLLPECALIPTICLERSEGVFGEESPVDLPAQSQAGGTAYISFTSGSTGKPKGVLVPHRAIVRLVRNTNYARFEPGDVFLQLAPLAFDASTFELSGCLLNGGTLVIAPPTLPSLSELTDIIARHRVTTAWFTSGLFNQIVDEEPELLKPLRQVFTGGDVLSPAQVRKALDVLGSNALINGYGPTENTTFSTCYRIPPDFDGKRGVPIGRPISNTTCYVLDEQLQPVPIGVPGELYLGGDGLAAGYLNDTELTAQKFIGSPFQGGERLYKTGDLVRWMVEGNLEFIGRNNDQVKIRGFRVELGEIEAALREHSRVRHCAVVTRADARGGREIIAYIVPGTKQLPDIEELQRFLAERLPNYMIPASVVILDELPLSRNGKLDRNALPAPEHSVAMAEEVAAPRNETETQMQAIWEEVLKVKPIGIHDRFFTLGGHSLLAIRLLARVEKIFAKQLKVAALFQHPTIAGLAALLRGNTRDNHSSIVEIQPYGSQMPLFLVHGAGGGMFWGYSNLARELGDDQPLFAFKSRGLEGEEELATIEELAAVYLADLRAFLPHGPYCLGGYCFGGVVAFEMSRQLQLQGEPVEFLGLINSTAPNSTYTQFEWTPGSAVRFTTNLARRGYYSARMRPGELSRYMFWKLQSSLIPRANGVRATHESAAEINDDWVDLSQYNEVERRVWKKHLNALRQYRPQRYPGRVWLFRSPVHLLRCSFEPDYGWRELATGGLFIHVIPAAHEALMLQPTVRDLAQTIKRSLLACR